MATGERPASGDAPDGEPVDGRIAVVARMVAKAGRREELLKEVAPMLDVAATEDGTLAYVVHRDAVDHDAIWFYEVYRDHDARLAHQRSVTYRKLAERTPELLASTPDVWPLTPAGAGKWV